MHLDHLDLGATDVLATACIAANDDVMAGGGAIVYPPNRYLRWVTFRCARPGGVMVEVSARPPRAASGSSARESG